MSGMEFGVLEFTEVLEDFANDGVGSRADGKSNEDFAKVEVISLEIGGLVLDLEDRFEDGGGDEIDFVGDFTDGLESVEEGAGDGGEVIGAATGDVAFADGDAGAGATGGFEFILGVGYNGALSFVDAKFVHEEFDAFGDFGVAETFLEVGDGAIITADDFGFSGMADGFVVGNTFADDVNPHVGRRIIDVLTGDAVENFFEDGEGFEVAVVIDGLDAVFVEMEMVDHIDIAEVGGSGFVGDIDRVFQRQGPDGEGLELGIAGIDTFLVFMVELGAGSGEFARAGARSRNDNKGTGGFDIRIGTVALV